MHNDTNYIARLVHLSVPHRIHPPSSPNTVDTWAFQWALNVLNDMSATKTHALRRPVLSRVNHLLEKGEVRAICFLFSVPMHVPTPTSVSVLVNPNTTQHTYPREHRCAPDAHVWVHYSRMTVRTRSGHDSIQTCTLRIGNLETWTARELEPRDRASQENVHHLRTCTT